MQRRIPQPHHTFHAADAFTPRPRYTLCFFCSLHPLAITITISHNSCIRSLHHRSQHKVHPLSHPDRRLSLSAMDQDDPQEEQLFQTVRPVHKNNLSPTIHAPVAHVVINIDPNNGKKIILWEDILQPFKDASYPRHGTKILPFLKGSDFNWYVCL